MTAVVTARRVIPVAGHDSMLLDPRGAHVPCFTLVVGTPSRERLLWPRDHGGIPPRRTRSPPPGWTYAPN